MARRTGLSTLRTPAGVRKNGASIAAAATPCGSPAILRAVATATSAPGARPEATILGSASPRWCQQPTRTGLRRRVEAWIESMLHVGQHIQALKASEFHTATPHCRLSQGPQRRASASSSGLPSRPSPSWGSCRGSAR